MTQRTTEKEQNKITLPLCNSVIPQCISVLLFILFLFPLNSFSQQTFSFGPGSLKHRISFGPVVSFFKNHPKHTVDTKAKMGFNFAYKAEIFLGRKTNLLTGLEYMTQGVKFRGYYKADGFTYLFDETFPYTHEVRFNEIQLPIGLKLSLNKEKDKAATPYFFGGIGARYIFSSYTVITNDSTDVSPYDGKGTLGFEHHWIAKGFNVFFSGGFGVQKNYRVTGRAVFFEFTYKYGISRLHYSGYQNSNDLKIGNNNLAITVGLRL